MREYRLLYNHQVALESGIEREIVEPIINATRIFPAYTLTGKIIHTVKYLGNNPTESASIRGSIS